MSGNNNFTFRLHSNGSSLTIASKGQFYITCTIEYGHAYQEIYDYKNSKVSYQNEHLANTIAMLYWRKIGKTKELNECYELAKKMFEKLPNPVPVGENKEDYFTKNYEQAASNPFVYAYMQFGQFITIYEDKNLPEFDVFMKTTFK